VADGSCYGFLVFDLPQRFIVEHCRNFPAHYSEATAGKRSVRQSASQFCVKLQVCAITIDF